MLQYHSEYDGFLFNKLFWYVEFKEIGKCLFFLQLSMQKRQKHYFKDNCTMKLSLKTQEVSWSSTWLNQFFPLNS